MMPISTNTLSVSFLGSVSCSPGVNDNLKLAEKIQKMCEKTVRLFAKCRYVRIFANSNGSIN